MLQDFSIQNFRTFRELTIDRLGQVNLIVGRNSVGKTTLLEAIGLYSARMQPEAIHEILLRRDEVLIEQGSDLRESDVDVRALFHGRIHLPESDNTIQLGPKDDPDSRVRLRMAWVEQNISSEPSPPGYSEIPEDGIEDAEGDVFPALSLDIGRNNRLIIKRHGSWFRSLSGVRRRTVDHLPPFVRARDLDEDLLARWWDAISLHDSESRVIESLKLLAPIERISLVESQRRHGNRLFVTRLKNSRTPQPLKSLGDGVERMFRTILALEYARRSLEHNQMEMISDISSGTSFLPNILLIDEVDTGIHYSAIPQYWSILFDLAQKLDVQVFATTHSWDCVEGFRAAITSKSSRNGKLVRVEESHGGGHQAIVIDKEALSIITRDDIEVR